MGHRKTFVSNIQRFSVDDGPGIRTTVFLMGCNLKCLWCHNPECLTGDIRVEFLADRCLACGRCREVCPRGLHHIESGARRTGPGRCLGCRACEAVCPGRALKITGRPLSPEEVLAVVKRDQAYYQKSGGGLTVSGGEPMLHRHYLRRLLTAAKLGGLATAVDTAGNVPFTWFKAVAPLTDIFLYDVKMFDSQKHETAAGVANRRILANLGQLTAMGARVIVRAPVITGLSTLDDLADIARFLAPLPVELTQLLPYHSYGLGKYKNLGLENTLTGLAPPSSEFMAEALALFKAKGVKACIN